MPTINPEVVPSNVKLNVTNMKTIFNGGGKGGVIVPKKGGTLARGGALSTEKVFQLNDFDPLEKRVAVNEKKITLLKNVLKAQKPFGGNEDKLAEINSTLQDIGNALSLDFANRITEQDAENKLKKKENEERKKNLAEKSLEGIKGAGKGLGTGIKGVASKVVSPFKNVFDKLISFVTLLGGGIAANAAITWWQDPENSKARDRISNTFNFLTKHWKWLAAGTGILLLTSVVGKIRQVWKLVKFVGSGFGLFKGAKNIPKGPKITTSGGKTVKNLKGPWWKRIFNRGVKSKATKKITGDVTEQIVKKSATRLGKKALVKKIPIIGLGAGLLFAGQRAMAGDFTGAGLELASGAASMVPGVGTGLSIAIDAGTVARDIHRANNNHEVPNLEVDETKVIVEDLPPIKASIPEKKVPLPETTEVTFISSINPLNEYMTLTPVLHGIV